MFIIEKYQTVVITVGQGQCLLTPLSNEQPLGNVLLINIFTLGITFSQVTVFKYV